MRYRLEFTKNGKVRLYINGKKVNRLFPNATAAERYAENRRVSL